MILPTLCCQFKEENIKFRKFTIKKINSLVENDRIELIEEVYSHNIDSLQKSLDYCYENNIPSFRIGSDLLPSFNYLKNNSIINDEFIDSIEKKLSIINSHDLILSMHPDQFCIMNSPKEEVVNNSVEILKYHFYLAKFLDIQSINIHVGGVYGDKASAIDRFIDNCKSYLSPIELMLLTIENDEKSFCFEDILSITNHLKLVRPVFDIHHEKCYNIKNNTLNENSISDYLKKSKEIWKSFGYNYFQIHISSPRDDRYLTLKGSQPHSEFIDEIDIIELNSDLDIVVDIEAKSKELAVKGFKETYERKYNEKA